MKELTEFSYHSDYFRELIITQFSENDIPSSSYIDNGKTLFTVNLAKSKLIISSLCETIADGSQDSYVFKPVRNTLEQFAFQDNPRLKKIGAYSFYFCEKLTNIDLSTCTSLLTIETHAFYQCSSVTSINLPEGLQKISENSLSYLKISNIIIPSSVITIEGLGISRIQTLNTITFSQGSQLTEISYNAFYLTKPTTFTVPQNVANISGVAFLGAGTMTSIYVDPMNQNFWSDGKAVYTKDKNAIIYCASIIGDSYTILPTVTKINEGCFLNSHLKSLIIPEIVTEIGVYAFAYSYIETLDLPPNITSIPYCCFLGASIKSIVIPSKVETIGDVSFSGCNSLTYIYIPESVTGLGGGCFPQNQNLQINVSEKSALNIDKQLLVLSKDNTSLTQSLSTSANIIIPSKVKIIKRDAFSSNTYLETVGFDGESELEEIHDSAFYKCIKLNRFDFGSKIRFIGSYAFANCPLSMSIIFPSTITKIYDSAFYNTKLTSVKFTSSSNLAIGDNAFYNCVLIDEVLFLCNGTITLGMNCFGLLTKLKSIQIPCNVTSVGTSCFYGCSAIDRVTFDQNQISFSSLAASMFKDCVSLSSFTIPTNCVSLDSECLSNTGIINVEIPDSVRYLCTQCFRYCSNLQSVVIRSTSNLERIDDNVFEGCYKFSRVSSFDSQNFMSESGAIYSHDRLRMYVYPPASPRVYFSLLEGVEYIESGAFAGCENVEVITIPDGNIQSIGENAFRGCIKLRQITLPSSIKYIGSGAFINCPLLTCGVIIQNSTPSFIDILKKSGLDVKSQLYCSRFSCHQRSLYSRDLPLSYYIVFILM